LKEPLKVKLLDHEYLVKSEEDDEQAGKIAKFVNDIFEEIRANATGLSEKKMAILAAFHIASEYFQSKKELDLIVKDIEDRTKVLIQKIDEKIGAENSN
jgi:cell division protein ZapA